MKSTRTVRGDVVLSGSIVVALGAAIALAPLTSAVGREDPIDSVRLLATVPRSSDALPAEFPVELHGDGGIDRVTSRLLGEYDGDRYWVARDVTGHVCILAQATSDHQLTVASCSNAQQLEQAGVSVEMAGRWRLSATLVPDSIDASTVAAGFSAISPNLVVRLKSTAASARLTLSRDAGKAGPTLHIGPETVAP